MEELSLADKLNVISGIFFKYNNLYYSIVAGDHDEKEEGGVFLHIECCVGKYRGEF